MTTETTELEEVRAILAGGDYGSLPNDWTLAQIAQARMDDIYKLRWQVRDTCVRAEKAEAQLRENDAAWAKGYQEAVNDRI